MKFRKDINALRAIAVAEVVLYHYKVRGFAGGFCGVDIFFVISGYLMTSIISGKLETESLSVLDFYSRRLKRIVPALLFLVLAVMAMGFFLYFPADYAQSNKNAASSLLFTSNMYYWAHSGYFDAASDTNVFLHTWSLSAEWQFYLIYPIILLFLNGCIKNRRLLMYTLVGITLFFFIGSIIFTSKVSATGSYYLLPTRCWEMLFGGIAFFTPQVFKKPLYRLIIAIGGFLAIIACQFYLNEKMDWPGPSTLLPVVATYLVIIAGCDSFAIFNWPAVQFIGKISYSLYLWHWPLYVMAQYAGVHFDWAALVVLGIIAILMALLSFRFVEQARYPSPIVILIGMALLTTAAFGLSCTTFNQLAFKPQAIAVANFPVTHKNDRIKQFNEGSCFINMTNKDPLKDKLHVADCLGIVKGQKNVLLLGDSHAAQFAQSFTQAFASRHIHLLQATGSATFPVLRRNGPDKCYDAVSYGLRKFIKDSGSNVDGVILSAYWMNLMTGDRNTLAYDLRKTLLYLQQKHIKAIILGQNETYTIPYPTIAAKSIQYGIPVSRYYFRQNVVVLNDFLAKKFGDNYINIYHINYSAQVSANGTPYMFDDNHFTNYGATLVVQRLMNNNLFLKFLGTKTDSLLNASNQ